MNRFDLVRQYPGGDRAFWDVPIYETGSFVAVPSLGALVPGWMLIIPRRSVLNTRALKQAERRELQELIARMSADMSAFLGEIFVFEHGSEAAGSLAGCGVDQAHVHIVPLPFDLIEAASRFDNDASIRWEKARISYNYFDFLPADAEYVSIWNPKTGTGLSGTMAISQSQWVRRVIAAELGNGMAWDYKIYPNYENLEATVDLFKTLLN